jgi:pimeloyl-ACP methyl ester carboxylesterase
MSKKVLFLMRGLIREARHWGPFLDYVQNELKDFKVVCLDIPGAGVYYQDLSPLSLDAMVAKMREDYLKHKGDTNYLVAISLGGMISSLWLTHFRHDFQKAILINSSFSHLSPFYKRLLPNALKELSKVFCMKGKARERHILTVVSNRPQNYDQAAELWDEIQKTKPVRKINYLRQVFAAMKFKLTGEKPNIPILVIGCPQDRMVDFSCSLKIQEYWQTELLTHPDAGHDLPTDEPDWTAKAVARFLTA